MTEKEFNLSEKIMPFAYKRKGDAIRKEDVKEFIKSVIEDIKDFEDKNRVDFPYIIKIIKQRAGEKLI